MSSQLTAPDLALRDTLLRGSFKQAMAALPGGVTIVTGRDPKRNEDVGITASAVCSVSLRPPKILVCVDRGSRSHDAFMTCTNFAINVLHASHVAVALRFAKPGGDKFAGFTGFYRSSLEVPLLRDAAAVLECRSDIVVRAGDHSILIADVVNASHRRVAPLLYFDRSFHTTTPIPTRRES